MNRIKFYHIPKSGGTAIFNMTKDWKLFKRAHPQQNHVQVYKYPPKIGEDGLIVIRHPYSRFLSAFYHMVDSCNPDFYYRNAKQSDCDTLNRMNIDFSKYHKDPNYFLSMFRKDPDVKRVLDTFSVFRPQFYWVKDFLGFRLHHSIKYILHQETLNEDFQKIANMLNEQVQWPNESESHRRISQHIVPLTEESKSILHELYRDDFKHFKFHPYIEV